MFLTAGKEAVSFFAILPHYGDLFEIGFEDIQIASEELLKVGHLVEDHPCVVGGANISWHRGFCILFFGEECDQVADG